MFLAALHIKILLCTTPTDLRKSIDGLCLVVDGSLEQNPGCGTVYVFCNRARDKIKILYWDRNGFCLLYKRLEKGRFKFPPLGENLVLELSELRWLLQGLDFRTLPKPQILSVKTYG